ncbi:MAG: ion channel, partial [Candidatus Binataceae bacterium]
MAEGKTLARRIGPGRLLRLESIGRGIALFIRAQYWFPHVPLAMALAFAGFLLLLAGFGTQWHTLVRHLPAAVSTMSPRKMPYLLVGVAMLVMAVGLIFRSRFVWIIALMLTALSASIAIELPQVTIPLLEYYDVVLLIALLLAHSAFDRSSLAAGTLFALTSSLLLLIYATFGSYYLGADFSPHISDLVTAVYYAIVTMSTVGYGDITPKTPEARMFAVSVIFLGIAVFATSISAIIAPMVSGSLNRVISRGSKRMKRSNHFVIVGMTALAYNTYRELKRRNQSVTLVVHQAPPEGELENDDIVIGDAGSLDVLRKADADQAQA